MHLRACCIQSELFLLVQQEKMKTLGLWILLLIVVMTVSMSEAQKWNKRRRNRVRYLPNLKRILRRGRIGGGIGRRRGGAGIGRRDTSLQKTLDVDFPCRFEMYDTNKDGYVSQQEVSSVVAKFDPGLETTDILNAIFQYLDRNGDGMLQIEEFYSNPEYQKDCIFGKTLKDMLNGPLEDVLRRKNSA